MKKTYAVLLIALVHLAFEPCGLTQDIVPTPIPSEQDDAAEIAAEKAVQRKAMQADWTTSASRAGRVRTFCVKVLDQDGQPAAGVMIGFTSMVTRADFFQSGIAWKTTDGEVVTDARGLATFTPAPYRKLDVYMWFKDKDATPRFREAYPRQVRPFTKYYEDTDSAPPPPDKDGLHMVFEVYRYRGPERLGWFGAVADITNDGEARAIALLGSPAGKSAIFSAAEAADPHDFRLVVKRPDAPYWHVAPAPDDPRVSSMREWPHYTLSLTCMQGGIMAFTAPDLLEAPAEGYVREIRWTSPAPQPGAFDPTYKGPGVIFWRRATTPASYARLQLRIDWRERRKSTEMPKPIYAAVDLVLLFNRQGGRLFERAEVADREHEPWITDLKPEEAAALGALPIDAAQLPPVDSVQVIGP